MRQIGSVVWREQDDAYANTLATELCLSRIASDADSCVTRNLLEPIGGLDFLRPVLT
jgi:hypothetical protein